MLINRKVYKTGWLKKNMARTSRAREDLGSFDILTAEQAREARRKLEILYPTELIFQQDVDLSKIQEFMNREYDPKAVHTVGAYRQALRELRELGVNIPFFSHLNFQYIENLYIRIETKIKEELARRKLSKLEEK